MPGATSQITAIVLGLITIVIGLILSSIVNSQAATTGSAANIGSFSGAQAMNDLVPLLFYVAIVGIGVGLMGVGFAGAAGRGPLRRQRR